MDEIRLIDANALKEEVNKKKVVGRFNTLLLIDNAPTVTNGTYEQGFRVGAYGRLDEIRPQGEWDKRHTELLKYFVKCEKCGEEIMTSHKNYCPNCGVKIKSDLDGFGVSGY